MNQSKIMGTEKNMFINAARMAEEERERAAGAESHKLARMVDQAGALIKVVGVGGGGTNAINTMISSGLDSVEFAAANTDTQSLSHSLSPVTIQVGKELTKGLGAGADPDIGRDATLEDRHEIMEALTGADMVFVTAGMGGGTGTGGASVVAQIARELGALTVGVVTKPFTFEGRRRAKHAEIGIERLREAVDTLIVIPNQKLLQMATPDMSLLEAFKLADKVLLDAVRGISDIINIPGTINVDFADVKTIMSKMGRALMGIGYAEGEGRAMKAATMAISSPLLEDVDIEGATGVLINITAAPSVGILELNEACSVIHESAHEDANIIMGAVIDEAMDDGIRVTVIATGFMEGDRETQDHSLFAPPPKKVLTNIRQDISSSYGATYPSASSRSKRFVSQASQTSGAYAASPAVNPEIRPDVGQTNPNLNHEPQTTATSQVMSDPVPAQAHEKTTEKKKIVPNSGGYVHPNTHPDMKDAPQPTSQDPQQHQQKSSAHSVSADLAPTPQGSGVSSQSRPDSGSATQQPEPQMKGGKILADQVVDAVPTNAATAKSRGPSSPPPAPISTQRVGVARQSHQQSTPRASLNPQNQQSYQRPMVSKPAARPAAPQNPQSKFRQPSKEQSSKHPGIVGEDLTSDIEDSIDNVIMMAGGAGETKEPAAAPAPSGSVDLEVPTFLRNSAQLSPSGVADPSGAPDKLSSQLKNKPSS